MYSRYRKFLNEKGPPLSEQFGARGHTLMSSKKFKKEVTQEIDENPHQQKDLRKVTQKILNKSLTKRNKDAGLSSLMASDASKSAVEKYMRIATTCENVHQVGKVKHSTKVHISTILPLNHNPDPNPYPNSRRGTRR